MYTLCDCYSRHEEKPDTFGIPDDLTVSALVPGDFVKLIFESEKPHPSGERMWVRITGRQGNRFQGTLANRPVFIDGLFLGDQIDFDVRHIACVDRS